MAIEVELKAHVNDWQQLKATIDREHAVVGPLYEVKDDIYYCRSGEDALFRLRVEQSGPSFSALQGKVVFTRKYKEMKEGIEVNQELEFCCEATEAEKAHAFFLSLGFEQYIRKTKKGYFYRWNVDSELPSLHLELVEVGTLGWFLEMEFVLEDEEKVPLARTFLRTILAQLGIAEHMIESRYYMHLLKHQTTG
jgi:adenylate cyclase class 2